MAPLKPPKIQSSTIEQWAEYYKLKAAEADNQLAYVCQKLPHILRLSAEGKHKDVGTLARMIANRLKYPRDKQPLEEEILKHPEYQGSLLRDDNDPNTRSA